MINDWRKPSTAWSSSTSRISSIETELTRPSLFLLPLFFLRECLNLVEALIAFFFRDPILVLLSSSEFSKSDLRSLLSSLPENPSKPKKLQNWKHQWEESRNWNRMKVLTRHCETIEGSGHCGIEIWEEENVETVVEKP